MVCYGLKRLNRQAIQGDELCPSGQCPQNRRNCVLALPPLAKHPVEKLDHLRTPGLPDS